MSVIQSLFISVIEDAYVSIKYIKKEDLFYGKGMNNVPIQDLARGRLGDE